MLTEIVHNDRSLTFMVMNTSFPLSSPCGCINIDASRDLFFSETLFYSLNFKVTVETEVLVNSLFHRVC